MKQFNFQKVFYKQFHIRNGINNNDTGSHTTQSLCRRSLRTLSACVLCFTVSFTCILQPVHDTYAATQEDLDRANAALDTLKQQQAQLSSDFSNLNSQLETSGQRIAGLDSQITQKQTEINDLQIKINDLSNQISDQYNSMKLRIKYMYEKDNTTIFDLLLNSKSMAELLTRTEYVYQISQYDREMLDQLNDIYMQNKEANEALTADMNELNSLRSQADAEYNNLNTLLSQTQTQLDTTADNITEAEQLALQYEQELENQRIEQERAEAEQARREAEAKAAAEQSSANTGISYDVTSSGSGSPLAHSDSDLAMLAAIIECEAGNQPYIGKLAVGSVVINRVNSSRFPNSISAVLYASGQFTPVASGRFAIVLARGASDSCVQAAQEVLNGNIVIDALFFHVYRSGTDNYGTVIGDHIFY